MNENGACTLSVPLKWRWTYSHSLFLSHIMATETADQGSLVFPSSLYSFRDFAFMRFNQYLWNRLRLAWRLNKELVMQIPFQGAQYLPNKIFVILVTFLTPAWNILDASTASAPGWDFLTLFFTDWLWTATKRWRRVWHMWAKWSF